MRIRFSNPFSYIFVLILTVVASAAIMAKAAPPEPLVLASGWQLQDAAKVPQAGSAVASTAFSTDGWYSATVPGTVLTTLVNNHVYPEPLYGENNRPEVIPESLARTSYWYRTLIDVPSSYKTAACGSTSTASITRLSCG